MEDFSPGNLPRRGLTAGDEHLSPSDPVQDKVLPPASSSESTSSNRSTGHCPVSSSKSSRSASFRERAAVRVWPWEANCRRAVRRSRPPDRPCGARTGRTGPPIPPGGGCPGGPEGPHKWTPWAPRGSGRYPRSGKRGSAPPGPRKSPAESGPPGGPVSPQSGPGSE